MFVFVCCLFANHKTAKTTTGPSTTTTSQPATTTGCIVVAFILLSSLLIVRVRAHVCYEPAISELFLFIFLFYYHVVRKVQHKKIKKFKKIFKKLKI